MKPIANFENVKEAGGPIENLPAGAYVCEIKMCTEKNNRNNNGTHLEIMFDIARGDYRGWFENDWNNQSREDKYWHGVINQNVPDERSPKYQTSLGFFKRFVNNIESSNPDYHWDWDERKLEGKLIGVVFGEVEKESQRGTRYMITRADSVVSVQEVENGKARVPQPKMLATQPNSFANGTPVPDDDFSDLPFA
jgi:hypothetical protein